MSVKYKEKMFNAAVNAMDDLYNEDVVSNKHSFRFIVYPTKRTQEFYDYVYENEVNNNNLSMSAFLRRLLNEYVKLPLIHREIIVHKKNYNFLNECCKNKHVVILETKKRHIKLLHLKL